MLSDCKFYVLQKLENKCFLRLNEHKMPQNKTKKKKHIEIVNFNQSLQSNIFNQIILINRRGF